jgi:hypothetical protein
MVFLLKIDTLRFRYVMLAFLTAKAGAWNREKSKNTRKKTEGLENDILLFCLVSIMEKIYPP